MIKINFLKSIAEKIKHRSVKTPGNFYRDWQLMLLLFCLVFIAAAFLSWRLNQTVANDQVPLKSADKAPITINRTLMDRVINFYKNQEEMFNQNKNADVDQADPSR
jgi:hypothetical protein